MALQPKAKHQSEQPTSLDDIGRTLQARLKSAQDEARDRGDEVKAFKIRSFSIEFLGFVSTVGRIFDASDRNRSYGSLIRDKESNKKAFDILSKQMYNYDSVIDVELYEDITFAANCLYERNVKVIEKRFEILALANAAKQRHEVLSDAAGALTLAIRNLGGSEIDQLNILQEIVALSGLGEFNIARKEVPKPPAPPNGELFTNRLDKLENAPAFVKRVYGQWLTGEFTRSDLKKLDSEAAAELSWWERSNGRAPFDLPTNKERNDRLLRRDPETLTKEERLAQQRLRAVRKYVKTRSP